MADNAAQAQPEIPGHVAVFREADGNAVGNLIDQLTDSEISDILEAINKEFFLPMKLSTFVVIAFWSLLVHGSLPIFLVIAATLFYIATFHRKDIRPLSHLRMLDIRLFQSSLMYLNLMHVTLLGAVVSPFKYFQAPDLQSMRHQILLFFSSIGSPLNIPIPVWVKITIQIYWLSLACIVMGRTIAHFFIMSTTPDFRAIMKYESQTQLVAALSILSGVAGFNFLADSYGHTIPIAVFLTSTLVTWIVFCLLKSTVFKEEMLIPRTNNIDGVMKVVTATTCQTILSGLFLMTFCVMDDILNHSFRQNTVDIKSEEDMMNVWISPIKGILVYFKDIRNNKFEIGSGRHIIPWDMELLVSVSFLISITRTLKHVRHVEYLNSILEQTLNQ